VHESCERRDPAKIWRDSGTAPLQRLGRVSPLSGNADSAQAARYRLFGGAVLPPTAGGADVEYAGLLRKSGRQTWGRSGKFLETHRQPKKAHRNGSTDANIVRCQ
jgi:hypothetical protein